MWPLILIMFAFVLFVVDVILTAANSPMPRINLVAAGLACWALSEILMRGFH